MRFNFFISLLFFLFLFASSANGQSTSDTTNQQWVYVESINLIGNKKTRDLIVYRELDFSVGDSLLVEELGARLERNRLFVLNTGVFNDAKINIKTWDQKTNRVGIEIEMKESWFFYPVPVFELADRDFNVWWKEFRFSPKRLNLGLRLFHINLTGNRDHLKIALQSGFAQKAQIRYNLPGINKAQTIGLTVDASYSRSKELGYKTVGNVVQFFRDSEDFLRYRRRAGFTFSYRPGLLTYHFLKVEYQHNNIDEYVATELNSNYFPNGQLSQRLIFLQYEFTHDNRDIKPYPMNGFYVYGALQKEGIGLFDDRNGMYALARYEKYFSFTDKWSLALVTKGKLALIRGFQNYNNFTGLGYQGDFIRGYELYAIDGLDYIYTKSTFRLKVMDREINYGRLMPLKAMRIMPFKVFLTLHNDVGYVTDNQYGDINPLGNQWLWGGGVGVNFLMYYDKVFRFEYSFNQLGESGLFFQYSLSF